MQEMERQTRMMGGNLEPMDRIPIGAEFDWLHPHGREGVYVYQAYFSDHWPSEYTKEEIRQCKINILMRVLDDAPGGYAWLFRFDERWDELKPWEQMQVNTLHNPALARHRKLTLRAGITKFSSYDDIIPDRNKRPIFWKPLKDYGTREMLVELGGRIKPGIYGYIGRRWRRFIRPLKFRIQIEFLTRRVQLRDKMRQFKVWRETEWNNFWRLKDRED